MSKNVLLIEDDPQTAQFIGVSLSEAGCVVEAADNGVAGLEMARQGDHQCVVLDRMMEGIDGLSLLQALRAEGYETPVMILSAIGSTDERVRGLCAGADDYLVKPFASAELVARVVSLMRRHSRAGPDQVALSCEDLHMDLMTGRVSRAGRQVNLSPRGLQLLGFLLRHKGNVVTRRMILEQVWHYDFDPGTNVIDVHVSNLRRAIDHSGLPQLLHTVRGTGYRLGVSRDGA